MGGPGRGRERRRRGRGERGRLTPALPQRPAAPNMAAAAGPRPFPPPRRKHPTRLPATLRLFPDGLGERLRSLRSDVSGESPPLSASGADGKSRRGVRRFPSLRAVFERSRKYPNIATGTSAVSVRGRKEPRGAEPLPIPTTIRRGGAREGPPPHGGSGLAAGHALLVQRGGARSGHGGGGGGGGFRAPRGRCCGDGAEAARGRRDPPKIFLKLFSLKGEGRERRRHPTSTHPPPHPPSRCPHRPVVGGRNGSGGGERKGARPL